MNNTPAAAEPAPADGMPGLGLMPIPLILGVAFGAALDEVDRVQSCLVDKALT
jgi:hypothetical protein